MDLDRDARRILDLATDARAPSAEDKARVDKKLAAVLGASALATVTATTAATTHAATAGSSSASVASGAALKWWIGTTVVAASLAGYVALSAPEAAPVKTPAAPSIAAPAQPTETAPTLPAALPVAPEPTAQPAAAAVPAHRPAAKKHGAATLHEELELLHRAQSAWRAHEPSSALGLLDEHRSRFPRSQLRLERDGLRVLTLCELGKKAEATALAKKLIERAPRSPLRATIEESCALK